MSFVFVSVLSSGMKWSARCITLITVACALCGSDLTFHGEREGHQGATALATAPDGRGGRAGAPCGARPVSAVSYVCLLDTTTFYYV